MFLLGTLLGQLFFTKSGSDRTLSSKPLGHFWDTFFDSNCKKSSFDCTLSSKPVGHFWDTFGTLFAFWTEKCPKSFRGPVDNFLNLWITHLIKSQSFIIFIA